MNWDKPLRLVDLQTNWKKSLKHHGYGVSEEEWQKFIKECGYTNFKGWDNFYNLYLNYCNIMSSPLGKALS